MQLPYALMRISHGITTIEDNGNDNKKSSNEKATQAYKLFSEGKKLTIQKVLDVLPEAAETAATFTPLAPISKLIGKGVRQIVDACLTCLQDDISS